MQWYVLPALGVTGIGAAFISGAVGGAIATGTAQGAFTGGITAGIFAGLDLGLTEVIKAADLVEVADGVRALSYAVAGGATSVIQGGDFKSGFLAAGFTALAGPRLNFKGVAGAVSRAVLGGAAAAIGGGKFANGAVTAAFAYSVSGGLSGGGRQNDGTGEAADARDEIWFSSDPLPGLSVNDNVVTGVLTVDCRGDYCGQWISAMHGINVRYGDYGIDLSFQAGSPGDFILREGKPGWTASSGEMQLARPGTFGVPPYSERHEVGHTLGFGHRTNATGSLMSYSGTRSPVLRQDEVRAIVDRYRR